MPGFRVYMFGSSPFPVPAAEVERGMSCTYYNLLQDWELIMKGFVVPEPAT